MIHGELKIMTGVPLTSLAHVREIKEKGYIDDYMIRSMHFIIAFEIHNSRSKIKYMLIRDVPDSFKDEACEAMFDRASRNNGVGYGIA